MLASFGDRYQIASASSVSVGLSVMAVTDWRSGWPGTAELVTDADSASSRPMRKIVLLL
jgi:hypothetical protein